MRGNRVEKYSAVMQVVSGVNTAFILLEFFRTGERAAQKYHKEVSV